MLEISNLKKKLMECVDKNGHKNACQKLKTISFEQSQCEFILF